MAHRTLLVTELNRHTQGLARMVRVVERGMHPDQAPTRHQYETLRAVHGLMVTASASVAAAERLATEFDKRREVVVPEDG